MKRCPKIGDRVSHPGHADDNGKLWWGPSTGTVSRIYPKHADQFDDDGEFIRRGPLRPESEWSVTIEVDELPFGWPYGKDCKRFAPEVADIEPLKGDK